MNWYAAWHDGRTGWHLGAVHADLAHYGPDWLAGGRQRVLVPLCGRSVDLIWLRDAGHDVVGVELVPEAVEGFFTSHGLDATTHEDGDFVVWRGGGVEIRQGDFFALASEPTFTRVWDRASLVAVEPEQRHAYARKLVDVLVPGGSMLVNSFEYDTSRMSGPPHAVPEDEIRGLYDALDVELLGRRAMPVQFDKVDRFDSVTCLARKPVAE